MANSRTGVGKTWRKLKHLVISESKKVRKWLRGEKKDGAHQVATIANLREL